MLFTYDFYSLSKYLGIDVKTLKRCFFFKQKEWIKKNIFNKIPASCI